MHSSTLSRRVTYGAIFDTFYSRLQKVAISATLAFEAARLASRRRL